MRRKLFLFAAIMVFIIVLADYAGINLTHINEEKFIKSAEFCSEVISIEEVSEEKTVLVVRIKDDNLKVLLTVYDCNVPPRYLWKADISFSGVIEKPQGRTNPGCFDYGRYLLSEGVQGVIRVDNIRIKQSREKHIENILIEKRFDYVNSLAGGCKGIVSGILFGDKDSLSEDIYEDFRENGTAHILAVSGLHVGVLYYLIKKIFGRSFSVVTLAITTIALLTYCFLSLWSFSAIRAAAMILLKEWGTYFDRRYDLLTAASLIAIVFMAINPYTIYNTSFQMSFLAVLSISFFQRLIPKKIPDNLSVMLAVNIGVVPYQIFQFNLLSVSSLIANIPVIYVAGILLPFALVEFVVFSLTDSDLGVGIMTEALSSLLIKTNEILSLGNFGHYDMVSMPLWVLLITYLTMFWISSEYFELLLLRRKTKIIMYYQLAFLTISLIIGAFAYNPLEKSDILFIDVGQGDCIHIKAGSRNLLIDGGGDTDYNVGKKTLKPYLLKNGIRKVDMALATHLHTDHYKGLAELYEEGMIKRITVRQTAGNTLHVDKNIKIKVLWPLNLDEDDNQDENENCSVFMIYYNKYKILITGDLDSAGEKKMMDYYKGTDSLKADILKIGHHGSKYSTCDEFLDAVNPNYAVIQVGRNNYGHPNPKVIEKCAEKGIILFRNDTHGCVGFSLSGEKIIYGIQSEKN